MIRIRSLLGFVTLSVFALASAPQLVALAHADEAAATPSATPAKKAAKTAKADKKTAKEQTAVMKVASADKKIQGEITLKLFPDRAPKTVANFVGLATGKKEWTNGEGKKVKGKSLYVGTIFHRVIPNFMIQGGDPLGNGTGGPGYQFEDETSPSDSFDKPGILAMANAGPNTNGSQFFITVKPTPWLNGKHTIFGEVTKGMDVVEKIVNAPRGPNDKPNVDIKITKLTIK
jgi:peptidyl-prolyl cis-trans isomerase A (cyclophilin A)